MFVDETGFSFRAKTGSTWAPRGQTPVLRRVSQRRAFSTVIGLTLSGRLYKRHWLPPYAPDLNPEEGGQGNGKQPRRNAHPSGASNLRAGVDRGFARLRR